MKMSPWYYIGDMSRQEAVEYEHRGRVIEQESVLGYTIYLLEDVICRFNGAQ
jgi:hypothetical protein